MNIFKSIRVYVIETVSFIPPSGIDIKAYLSASTVYQAYIIKLLTQLSDEILSNMVLLQEKARIDFGCVLDLAMRYIIDLSLTEYGSYLFFLQKLITPIMLFTCTCNCKLPACINEIGKYGKNFSISLPLLPNGLHVGHGCTVLRA